MDSIEAQFAEFSGVLNILEIVALIFLLAITSETIWDIVFGKRKKWGETFANFAIAIVAAVLERTAYGAVFVVGLVIASLFAFAEIPHMWWSWVLAILLADFTYYWMHRWEHEVRILWAYHSVHHSSPEFNLTTALRLAWIEGLIEWAFFVPMILIGFSVVQTIIALAIVVAYQTWIHTEKISKLGWLDKVLNTPSVHRVHHASNAQYIDKNYGGILIIWDRLFGTYAPENEKVVFGITKPINSFNPLIINFKEYWLIIKDVKQAKSMRDAFGYIFYRPGWKPKPEKTNQEDK
ncbi:C-5 sterol desaturase [Nymphon striatum]|nr:C-5 sterol desaturase [Nymphon striatum]